MAKAKRYANDKQAMAALVKALEVLPDHMLSCKSMLHAWAVENDYYVEQVVQEGRRRVNHIARMLVCMRGCGVFKKQHFIQGKHGLEQVGYSYIYTDPAYKMTGLPRGMKPGDVVRQEEYNRAMIRAAEAANKKVKVKGR